MVATNADAGAPATPVEASPIVETAAALMETLAVEAEESAVPRVQLRNRNRAPAVAPVAEDPNRTATEAAATALQRARGTLNEVAPDHDDNSEEIRRLDTQLDHLNEYMNKVEARLNAHNAKLVESLKQQREDREKRRQSFHERVQQNRQEDDQFQQQMAALFSQLDSAKKRSSILADLALSPPQEKPAAAKE